MSQSELLCYRKTSKLNDFMNLQYNKGRLAVHNVLTISLPSIEDGRGNMCFNAFVFTINQSITNRQETYKMPKKLRSILRATISLENFKRISRIV